MSLSYLLKLLPITWNKFWLSWQINEFWLLLMGWFCLPFDFLFRLVPFSMFSFFEFLFLCDKGWFLYSSLVSFTSTFLFICLFCHFLFFLFEKWSFLFTCWWYISWHLVTSIHTGCGMTYIRTFGGYFQIDSPVPLINLLLYICRTTLRFFLVHGLLFGRTIILMFSLPLLRHLHNVWKSKEDNTMHPVLSGGSRGGGG